MILYHGKLYENTLELVSSIQFDNWTDDQIEAFYINTIMPHDSRSISEIMENADRLTIELTGGY